MTERAIPPSEKGSSSPRWGWAGLGFVCLIALCAFEYLNFTNFCYAEVRYLGDQGICDGAIRDAIARVRPEDVVRGAKKYSSLEEFHQARPGLLHLGRATAAATCRMGQAGFGPVLHSRLSLVEIQGQWATTIHDGTLPCGFLRQGSRCKQGREYKP